MVERDDSHKRQITLRQRDKYNKRKMESWRSIEVRKSVHAMIAADRRNGAETYGEVVARWGRERAKYRDVYGEMTTVLITPRQTDEI